MKVNNHHPISTRTARKIQYLLLALILTAGWIGQTVFGSEHSKKVFPYEGTYSDYSEGAIWTFEHHGVRSAGEIGQPVNGDRVVEIISKQVIDGTEMWVMKEKWGVEDFNPTRCFIDSKRYLHRVEHGAFEAAVKPASQYDFFDLKPGEEKEFECDQVSDTLVIHIRVHVKRLIDETIETPAGIFQDCQKVKIDLSCTLSNQQNPLKFNYMNWYHPKANGLVKESFLLVQQENVPQTLQGVSLLKSYTIKQKES